MSRYWFGRVHSRTTHIGSEGSTASIVDAAEISSFWAQAYTGALTAKYRRHRRPKVKNLVVELSKRYRIDTELTSYLAIPDSEWAAYEDRLDQAKREEIQQYIYEAEQLRWVAQLPRWVVPGDPVIRVQHRPELEQVIALLPDGDVLPLRLDATTGIWEARFDIPEGAKEGSYSVVVVLLERDGKRSEVKLTYEVDLTSPTATVRTVTADGPRVELTASADTARAVLFFADGSRLELTPTGTKSGSSKLAAPISRTSGRHPIRIRIYDRVHNWIELEDEIVVP